LVELVTIWIFLDTDGLKSAEPAQNSALSCGWRWWLWFMQRLHGGNFCV